ncbi:CHAT domain-containing protein [Larkinella punicea]|nr:CHAT domain-containing protein [Larkinella punicea]
MSKPVIFIASANPSTLNDLQYLNAVDDEIKYIDELLYDLEINQDIVYPTPSTKTDADSIHRALVKIGQELTIFHYCGHASQTHFVLSDGIYNQNQLVKLLSGKKPKLIFLNGCSTYGYVDTLLAHGVEAIIATSTAVPDGQASELAKNFYYSFTRPHKTLQQAFDEAVSKSPLLSEKKSTLFTRGGFPTENPEVPCAWGLYYNQPEVLKWTLVSKREPSEKVPLIDRQKAFLCDRDQYRNVFDPSFNLSQGLDVLYRPVQHYLIVGADYQSPLGLARKLVYEKITKNPNRIYNYPFDPNDRRRDADDMLVKLNRAYDTPVKIRRELYKIIKGQDDSTSLTFDEFLGIPAIKNSQYTIVALQINADDLNEKVLASIRQFMTEFCPPETGTNSSAHPYLLFFWNIIFTPKQSWFSAFMPGNSVKKILKPFRTSGLVDPDDPARSPLIILNQDDELLAVPDQRKYLEEWFRNYLRHAPDADKERVITSIFQPDHPGKIDVPALEDKLLTLIERFNTPQTP